MVIHMIARSWCFTLNNPTIEEINSLEEIASRYMIYGYEKGENGTPHLQGYIELGNAQRLSGMRRLLARAHWEGRRGTRDEARTYCMKDGEWVEFGDWEAGGQGTRNDLRDLMRTMRESRCLMTVMEQYPTLTSRNLRFVEKYQQLSEKEDSRDFRKVNVQVYVGDAGSGKTRKAHEDHPEIFTVNSDEAFPFDGYDGEEAILIDDFYGGIKYGVLLRILDGHQFRVNVKGGHRYARWTNVIITSNKQPTEWYQRGLEPALARRLTSVTVFRNEEAGNTGAASE